ncbi:lipase [Streptomyces sp. NBC_00210]|uniref:alpha/beta hydrolase family protein n=1 Tax=unclassified Streptomyces TaxID=2593676 RepID=UPI00324827B5
MVVFGATLVPVLAAGPTTVNAAPAAAPVRLTLPGPGGPYRRRIGTRSLHLVDRSRPDPWGSGRPYREIMVQLWYPARDTEGRPRAPWMSPGAAAHYRKVTGIPEDAVRLPVTHGRAGAPPDTCRGPLPVVVYSPGFGTDRTSSTALVEELASHGYAVVTIDHTYDASEVEFPDGRVETGNIALAGDEIDDPVIVKALEVRVADTRFVLDRLGGIGRGAFDLSRAGMFGHSLGGATAAALMGRDRRIRAGINMDGSVTASVSAAGADLPFLLMGADQEDDGTWEALWPHLRGWRRELRLTGSRHASFTDLSVLLPQAAPALGISPEQVTAVLGPLDGQRAIAVERAYLRAFFDLHLREARPAILTGPSARYPEMRFIRP